MLEIDRGHDVWRQFGQADADSHRWPNHEYNGHSLCLFLPYEGPGSEAVTGIGKSRERWTQLSRTIAITSHGPTTKYAGQGRVTWAGYKVTTEYNLMYRDLRPLEPRTKKRQHSSSHPAASDHLSFLLPSCSQPPSPCNDAPHRPSCCSTSRRTSMDGISRTSLDIHHLPWSTNRSRRQQLRIE